MKNILRNKNGISLMESLLAAGLLGIISLFVVQLSNMSRKSQKHFSNSTEITSILKEIKSILEDPESCKKTFNTANAQSGTNVASAITSHNPSGTDRIVFELGKSYGQGNIKILSYDLSDAHDTVDVSSNTTHLIINFDLGKSSFRNTLTRKIRLNVETSLAAPLGDDVDFTIDRCQVLPDVTEHELNLSWTTTTNTSDGATLTTNSNYMFDTSADPYTLNLPAGVENGDIIRFVHAGGSMTTSPLTLVAASGDTIVGDSSLVVDMNNVSFGLIFYDIDGDGNGEWRIY